MARRQFLVLGLPALVIFLVILVFAGPWAQKLGRILRGSEVPAPASIVGEILILDGKINLASATTPTRVVRGPLTQTLILHDGQRVEVEARSRVQLRLNSGDELALPELSAVAFELWNKADARSPVYMSVLAGEYELLKEGKRGGAYVVKGGKLFFPANKPKAGASMLVASKTNSLVVGGGAPGGNTVTNASDSEGASTGQPTTLEEENSKAQGQTMVAPKTLSNEFISEVIKSHSQRFQHCHLQRLKDRPGIKGRVTVAVRIVPRGTVESPRILEGSIQDETLQKCVLSVFERMQFRPFSGATIEFNYPIIFE